MWGGALSISVCTNQGRIVYHFQVVDSCHDHNLTGLLQVVGAEAEALKR